MSPYSNNNNNNNKKKNSNNRFLRHHHHHDQQFQKKKSTINPMSSNNENINVNNNNSNNKSWNKILDILGAPVEKDGKSLPRVSMTEAIMTVLFIPIWASTILPITITYQILLMSFKGNQVTTSTVDTKNDNNDDSDVVSSSATKIDSNIDSGYPLVNKSDIIPHSQRKYDIILLGVTGFTGALGVRHLIQTYGVNTKEIKWAIAGRSQIKLDELKVQLAKEFNNNDILNIDTIIVDTLLPSTIPNLVSTTRVIATTVGPFAEYGNYLVEYCVKFGTHYVDITGETNWAYDTMMVQWDELAQVTGSKIIPLCGHDAIPWDLTVFKLQEAIVINNNNKKKMKGGDDDENNKIVDDDDDDDDETLESVTCWNLHVSKPSGGTLATISNALSGNNDKKKDSSSSQVPNNNPLFDPVLKLPNGQKSPFRATSDLPFRPSKGSPIIVPHGQKSKGEQREESLSSSFFYTTPPVMAGINFRVIQRSNALAAVTGHGGSPSLHYREVSVSPDFVTTWVGYLQTCMFFSTLMNPLTNKFVLQQSGIVPKQGEGPSMEFMTNDGFLCVKGEGIGTKGSIVETSLYFPKDPGYIETARMLVESALCLALENDKLPAKQGGFWTPASGLGNVLLNRLCNTGTYFESRVHDDVKA